MAGEGPNLSAAAMLAPLADIMTPSSPPPQPTQTAPQTVPTNPAGIASSSFSSLFPSDMNEASQIAVSVLSDPNLNPTSPISTLAKQVLALNETVRQLKAQLESKTS